MEEMPKDDIEIIDGEAQIKKVDRNSTFHEYVINANKRTRIRENTLYFPGWKVYDNENLVTEVEFQDPKNRGLITFYVDEGLHSIIIRFEDTKLRKFANLVSLISLSGLLVLPLILLTQIKLKIKK